MTSTKTKTVAVSPVKVASAFLTVDVSKVDKGAALTMLAETFAQSDVKGEGAAADQAEVSAAADALARLRRDASAREARRGEARVAFAIGAFALTSRKIATGKEIASAVGTSAAYVSQIVSDGRRMILLGSTSPAMLTTLSVTRKRDGAGAADALVAKALETVPAPVSNKPDAKPRKVTVPASVVAEIASGGQEKNKGGRPPRGEIRLSALAATIGRMHETLTDTDAKIVGEEKDRDALVAALTRMLAAAKALPTA